MPLLPNVTPAMLLPEFWLSRLADPDRATFDAAALADLNATVPALIGIPGVLGLPDALDAADVLALLPAVGQRPRYDADGAAFGQADWEAIRANLALEALPARIVPRYGLAVRRTALRTYPSSRIALKEPGDLPFDRFSETTVDAGWPVAVLHTSADGAWAYALTPHYWGWLRLADVGLAERAVVRDFVQAEPFAVAVGPWADVALAGGQPPVVLEMGSRLPLAGANIVLVPTRLADGSLAIARGYLRAGDADWRIGYAPASPRAILEAAFRVLGEPYAWGGMRLGRPGRDCSGFVQDVWGTAGVRLPRNAGQQEMIGQTVVAFEPFEAPEVRAARLIAQGAPGDLLLMDGHVMLYLGEVDGRPYAIHDLWQYRHPDGSLTLAGAVVVSDLPLERSTERHTLLERLTRVQRMQPPG